MSEPQPHEGFIEEPLAEGVLRWTLSNEARRNAVTPDALRFIARRCEQLRGQIVVLTGAGDRAFCSGFDLTKLRADGVELPDAPLITATEAMDRADATFVAAINGYAIGAGVELCCACDLRIAVRDATFRIPAASLGVVYHAEGMARIHAVFGPASTRALFLLGRDVAAEQARQAGALLQVVDRGDLTTTITRVIDELRAAAPASLQGNRDLLRALERPALSHADLEGHDALRRRAYARLTPRDIDDPDATT